MKKAVSIPKLKAKCQLLCNEYVRLRDQGKPCISCGQTTESKIESCFICLVATETGRL